MAKIKHGYDKKSDLFTLLGSILDCCFITKLCLTFAIPGTVAHQAPLSMDVPGRNTGVGCHFLLQGIFPTQGSNPCLLHWQVDSLPLTEPPLKPTLFYTGHKFTSLKLLFLKKDQETRN